MLGIGLGVLKLAPNVLWSMTLPEIEAAVQGHLGRIGREPELRRGDLNTLMQQFPDGVNTNG